MRVKNALAAGLFLATATATALWGAQPLKVVSAGPTREIYNLSQANEIRVQFSKPMVVLGKVPKVVNAPYFHLKPAIPGEFRWAGTRLLIFTLDAKKPLPLETTYTVTIDKTAKALDGSTLGEPYTFSFTTPTVKLGYIPWRRCYRNGGRATGNLLMLVRFNQAVDPQAVLAHLQVHFMPHNQQWSQPVLDDKAIEAAKSFAPGAVKAFEAKRSRVLKTVTSNAPVKFRLAKDWDHKLWKPSANLVVLETQTPPPPGAWLELATDGKLPGKEGRATSGQSQSLIYRTAPAFFVKGLYCSSQCPKDYYNTVNLTVDVTAKRLQDHLRIYDISEPDKRVPVGLSPVTAKDSEGDTGPSWSSSISFDSLGFSPEADHTYLLVAGPDLAARDGQTLGYTWAKIVDYWHDPAFLSFGGGHGVWETTSGTQLPFYARNFQTIWEWVEPLTADQLVPAALKVEGYKYPPSWTLHPWGDSLDTTESDSAKIPDVPAKTRTLSPTPDETQNYGINLKGRLSKQGTGLVWLGVEGQEPIPKAAFSVGQRSATASLIQVTNMGVTVKDSPLNTLIFVTTLDKGAPVAGAHVEIRRLNNKIFWQGETDKNGLALAPNTNFWLGRSTNGPRFIVIVRKDGDTAYVESNWNEGIQSWNFNLDYDLSEAKPILRGTVFADRGVYRLGETVHLKAILRSDTNTGIKLFDAGAKVKIVLTDSQDNKLDSRELPLSEWGTADWTFTLPKEAPLGTYNVKATVQGQKTAVNGRFLVAAYRKPDFRVDTTLGGAGRLAGAQLKGVIQARYLFGVPMGGQSVDWTFSRTLVNQPPRSVYTHCNPDHYVFLQNAWDAQPDDESQAALQTKQAKLAPDGTIHLDLQTGVTVGQPYRYTLEGTVTSVSRQEISGRASVLVNPAPWYIGLQTPPFFTDMKDGVKTRVVAVRPDGDLAAGVKVKTSLVHLQWISSRQARGDGFYDWTSTLKRKTVWTKEITTGAKPVDVHIPLKKGGLYILTATAGDAAGRSTTTNTEFYVLGPGYTAWARSDNNIIDLVPEHKSYKPGDTARIMIKSPWEKATALYTVEREGIRQYHEFALTSTQQTIEVPITQKDIPNVYVSVLLVKGRTSDVIAKDGSDPGKPTFRMGYCELKVDNAAKRLHVDISTDKEEYRPADNATVTVKVKDANGKPAHAEVTLWAVDYGVLSLTGYKTPDVLGDIYAEKALQVMNEDSRQRLISRRVITPKGAETGGGGGVDNGPGVPVRKDFRVLAFWIGSAATDNNGTYTTTVKLPEGLTSYRIMAVVNDKENRFGKGQKEIRVSKKVLLTSAFPRFLTVGDKAYFGAVLTSRLKQAGTAQVAVKGLDPGILKVTGEAKKQVDMKPGESSEVRFQFKAGAVGKARIQMSVRLLNESDAFQKSIPVELLIPPEVVAAYGIAHPETTEKVALPGGVLPKVGGLSFELSSTAMVGLGEGARYLVSYPYGCAEQRASCALALMLAADLGDAFKLPGVPAGKLKEITQQTLDDLKNFQCDSGGFVYWKGSACLAASPYLTSYVLHVMQEGVKLGYKVPSDELQKGYGFLSGALNSSPPDDASTLPAYLGWQAFAVKVLAAGGRTVDSQINRLYSLRESMPVYGLCWLWDAMKTSGIHDGRTADLKTRIDNTILPEAGTAHVEELNDPYLLWYWSSNVRSTAIALGSIVRDSNDSSLVPQMVRWLMKVRKKGRWGNTQENAWAMESLVDYYKKYEKEVPDFTAVVRLGMKQLIAARFKGRSTQVKTKGLPMQKLLKMGNTGAVLPLDFKIWGTGKLFYVTRLKYASTESKKPPMDHGFSLTRSYAVMTGDKAGPSTTTVKAGDVVEVTLTFFLTKGRRFVAVTDPLPAGLEPVESWFQTTSSRLSRMQDNGGSDNQNWRDWFMRGGWDHVERHDDRVQLFATWLSEGKHVFKYLCRATTAGTFRAGSAHVEEMYEPEVWGRSSSVELTVQKK